MDLSHLKIEIGPYDRLPISLEISKINRCLCDLHAAREPLQSKGEQAADDKPLKLPPQSRCQQGKVRLGNKEFDQERGSHV